jgi:hypothetical protein
MSQPRPFFDPATSCTRHSLQRDLIQVGADRISPSLLDVNERRFSSRHRGRGDHCHSRLLVPHISTLDNPTGAMVLLVCRTCCQRFSSVFTTLSAMYGRQLFNVMWHCLGRPSSRSVCDDWCMEGQMARLKDVLLDCVARISEKS